MDLVRLAHDLVAIPSMNPMGREECGAGFGERALAAHLDTLLQGMGAATLLTWPVPDRPNLCAWFDFGAPDTVLFEAHLDTVPADNMTIAPFGAEVRDDRLWGRGACDVKGPMAAMLWAVDRAAKAGRARRNVLFCAVMDEEYQFTGVRHLLDHLPDAWRARITYAVVAEPTGLRPVAAHKGVVRWRATARGLAAHSSTPHLGENAIYKLADATLALRNHADTLAAGPAHPLLGHATLGVGIVRGGSAVNIVPDTAVAEIDRRLIPGEDPAAVTRTVRALVEPFGVELSEPIMGAPAFETDADAPAVRDTLAAAARAEVDAAPLAVNYCTDASFYPAHGIPAVVFGPGDIAQAHTKDEWIALDQLRRGGEAYSALLDPEA